MKQITIEESSEYISQEEDRMGSKLAFYTLEIDGDGWDKVTYFTARRTNTYSNRGKGTHGFIYYQTQQCLTYLK
jgi:hypothetical protein